MQQKPSISSKNRILSRLPADDKALLKPDLEPVELALRQVPEAPHLTARSGGSGWSMSALPPKADMFSVEIDVCKVPIADISRWKAQKSPHSR